MTRRERAIATAREREPDFRTEREQAGLERLLTAVRGTETPRSLRSAWWLVPATAALVLLAYGGARFWPKSAPIEQPGASSAPVAPRKLAFEDGSEVELAANAAVTIVDQKRESVRVVHQAGTASYRVAHRPARSFVVEAGDTRISVRGTEFSVSLDATTVEVRVASGRVEVNDGERTTTLVSGEMLRVRAWQPQPPASAPALVPLPPAPSVTPASPATPATPEARAPEAGAAKQDPVDALFQEVTDARRGGNLDVAARKLREISARFPRDPRVASAEFTLGRVERARGRPAAAAEAFARCMRFAPGGTLAAEALAEEAAAWWSAGQQQRAADAARRYLARYPRGPRADKMHKLE